MITSDCLKENMKNEESVRTDASQQNNNSIIRSFWKSSLTWQIDNIISADQATTYWASHVEIDVFAQPQQQREAKLFSPTTMMANNSIPI